MGKKQFYHSGFTIIELVVVVTVIAILAAVGIVGYGAWRAQTSQNAVKSDLTALAGAMETEVNFGQTYPDTIPSTFAASASVQSLQLNTSSTGDYYCASAESVDTPGTLFHVTSENKTVAEGGCPDYTGVAVAKGLVSWWKLNGNAIDSTGSGNNGTVNGPVPGVGQNGASNGSYSFDGVDDYISIPNSVPQSLGAFSVSAWARVVAGSGTDSGSHGYIFHRGMGYGISNSIYYLGLLWTSPGKVYVGGVNGQVGQTTTFENALTWRFIVLTYDGSSRRVYIDGALVLNTKIGAITNQTTANATTIGGSSFNPTGRPVLGHIDDVRVYSRALTQTDISALYTAGAQ